jgi:hypothetical protein
VEGKTQEELLEVQRTSEVGGDIYQAATFEIQRIQQDTNNIQIASLIEEIKKLKNITENNSESSIQNARSSNKLSKVAIGIALASLITQVIFSTHQEIHCAYINSIAGEPFVSYDDCYLHFDFGLLGSPVFRIPDYKVSVK